VRNEVGTEVYTAHRIDYGINGEVVLYVMGESWEWDGDPEHCETDYTYAVSYAREFRYDNAMQRYLNVELDPTDDFEPIETLWTDYDGDRVYGDFEVVNSALADTVSHEPGIGFVDDPTGTPAPGYYHGDMLGTTRRTTNASAAQVDNAAYTAFGEFLGGSADRRYGFAGAWQYQSHPGTGFPFLHVGHRYYDPATGRFLQRDPIGIGGGANVYLYASGSPTRGVDPEGLAADRSFWPPNRGGYRYGPSRRKGAPPSDRRYAFRFPGRKGGPHIWGARGAALFGGCVAVAAGVGVAGGLAIDHFVVKRRQQNQFDRDYANLDGSMSPHDPSNPWGWEKGTSWEAPAPTPRPDPPMCFVKGTLVWTPDGAVAIETLREGDTVLSWDAEAQRVSYGQVVGESRGTDTEIVAVALDSEVVYCTPEHPFYVSGEGWVAAGGLRRGLELTVRTGASIAVVHSECIQASGHVQTHNLTVEPQHCFFVGEAGILVHNSEFLK
jgi:RHS repeat-associated protein